MDSFEYFFRLYLPPKLKESQMMKLFLSNHFVSFFEPSQFGFSEDTKVDFSSTSVESLADFFYDNYGFYLKSKSKNLIWFSEFLEEFNMIVIYLRYKKEKALFRQNITDLLKNLPFCMIRGSSEQENAAKHKEIEYQSGEISGIGAVGISAKEFLQYLPGIYSFTVFSSDIIEFFSRAKLEGMKIEFPNLEYFEGNNYFGFQIDDENQPLEKVIQIQKEIAQYLGQEYFFDRDLMGIVDFKPISTILEKIK
jgi:hypothetical protein